MGVYKKAVITDAGFSMLSKAIAGGTPICFSRAVTSGYIYADETGLQALTELQDIRQESVPSSIQAAGEAMVSIRALFENKNVLDTYLVQNVGLYARTGENEILFSVSQAMTPDEVPAYNGVAPSSLVYNIQLAIAGASQFVFQVDSAGVMTVVDYLKLQKIIQEEGEKIDRINRLSEATLTAEGWTDTVPYEQTVPAAGMLDKDVPIIACSTDVSDKAEKKALQKAWNMVDRIVAGNGQITAYCNFEKPSVNLPLQIKGG
ncbi:MAG: hypothetical protein HFE83_02425 [Lachnospiraceae bacterium]|nr:hypothetical protein [Lachnospiraceae bacterium]